MTNPSSDSAYGSPPWHPLNPAGRSTSSLFSRSNPPASLHNSSTHSDLVGARSALSSQHFPCTGSSLPSHSFPRSTNTRLFALPATHFESSYDSFFGSLSPSLPINETPKTYDDLWKSSTFTSIASHEQSRNIIDELLMQPPPPGHTLFSSPEPKSTESRDVTMLTPPTSSAVNPHPAPFANFGKFTTSDNFIMSMSVDDPLPETRKDPLDSPIPRGRTPKRKKPALTLNQKLEKLFDLLHDYEWTIEDLLYHLFTHQDGENNHIH
ncbi:hypothetical protein B0H17DRAFT_1140780 [Mycena rosella]|uniref:Uncharacterized protein n=1 Tax=Mycena rosella TaxID=1033263 RepID=A0AAD7GAZ7_MYCRO|nr:hypothetical protein B0H17DRAFT_1140780 [Mycena rosella]